jgi:hypothetical protein
MCNRMWRNGIRKPLIFRLPCFYEVLESYFELSGYIYTVLHLAVHLISFSSKGY